MYYSLVPEDNWMEETQTLGVGGNVGRTGGEWLCFYKDIPDDVANGHLKGAPGLHQE